MPSVGKQKRPSSRSVGSSTVGAVGAVSSLAGDAATATSSEVWLLPLCCSVNKGSSNGGAVASTCGRATGSSMPSGSSPVSGSMGATSGVALASAEAKPSCAALGSSSVSKKNSAEPLARPPECRCHRSGWRG